MANGIHEFTATGRQKKPSEELICSWIADAWREIATDMDQMMEIILFTKTNDELVDDDTFVRETFMSDSESESEFEGFDV